MIDFIDGVYGVAIGTAIALIFDLLATKNPAGIPLHLVIWRAAFGVVLYFAFWFTITCGFTWLLPDLGATTYVVLGVVFPQLSRLKDSSLVDTTVARKFPNLFIRLQYFDELTRKYFQKMIDREERKATSRALNGNLAAHIAILDRMFEYHLPDILRHQASQPDRSRVLRIPLVSVPSVKCRFVLRLLGYTEFFNELERVRRDPKSMLPSWPPETGNRRNGGDRRRRKGTHEPERRMRPFGRRQFDDPRVIKDLLDGED